MFARVCEALADPRGGISGGGVPDAGVACESSLHGRETTPDEFLISQCRFAGRVVVPVDGFVDDRLGEVVTVPLVPVGAFDDCVDVIVPKQLYRWGTVALRPITNKSPKVKQ